MHNVEIHALYSSPNIIRNLKLRRVRWAGHVAHMEVFRNAYRVLVGRKLHNVEIHTLYSSPNIIRNLKLRRVRWAGHVARMEVFRNAYRVLVGRPEGKRPLGKLQCRWEDNFNMDLREVGCDAGDWKHLAQDRVQWRAYVRVVIDF